MVQFFAVNFSTNDKLFAYVLRARSKRNDFCFWACHRSDLF